MSVITLEELLAAKEGRAERRCRMQQKYPGACVSLSLNIPGQKKDSPRVRALFHYAVERIESSFLVVSRCIVHEKAGPHAVFSVVGKAAEVKEIACRLETEKAYCRLLDIDVYDALGNNAVSFSRTGGRPCFICDVSAVACMRERRHSAKEIAECVDLLFSVFQKEQEQSLA